SGGNIGDEAVHLLTGQATGDLAQAQGDLVAVDSIDVEVNRDLSRASGRQPVQQRSAGRTHIVGAEGAQAPGGDVRVVVLGPLVQARQGDPLGGNGRGELGDDLLITVPEQRCQG